MSSVLDIRLREGRRGRVQGSGEMSPAGVAGLLEGGFRHERGSWVASYRAGLLDLVRRPAQLTAVPAYRDGHTKVSYDVSPNGRITAFALVGSSRVDVTRDGADSTDEFATTKRAAGATWTAARARRANANRTLRCGINIRRAGVGSSDPRGSVHQRLNGAAFRR